MNKYGDQHLYRFVYPFLHEGDHVALADALGKHFSHDQLTALLAHQDADTMKVAILSLALVGRMSEYDRLTALLRHHDPFVRGLVEYALWSISVRAGSSSHTRLLLEAVRHIAANRRSEALLLLNRLLVENPEFAEALYQRALVHHTNGDYPAALQDCRRAVELNRHHHGAHAQMGHTYAQLDEFQRALDCYYNALRIHPHLEGLRENLRCLRRLLVKPKADQTHA